ncbi:MAG: tyrosine-type recombinase/integrase [Porphyrobacter sp.]|nr:tyrosine-type recombinase/integrase [Porphyrobacter sp.]
MPRKRRLPRNVSAFVDRHGKERFRYRKKGQPVRYFQATFGTPEFDAELETYRQAAPAQIERHAHGTVGWLAARFRVSAAFRNGKGADSERNSWAILEKFVGEFRNDRVADFRFDHIEAVLARAAVVRVENGRRRGGPHAASNLYGELVPFFRYAIRQGLIATNPVELADAPKVPRSQGFHTWTDDEIEQYRAAHALGTKARLALEIFLWTALRRGDASGFGRAHLKAGKIAYTHAKTGQTVWMPAAPQLVEAIEAMAVTGRETYLVTDYGKPFSKAGLGNKMREWCNQAGLPHCSAHGLRKAAARRAAEHGGSNAELKALGGWRTDSQVAVYTEAADRERLAGQALAPVIAADLANRRKGLAKSD